MSKKEEVKQFRTNIEARAKKTGYTFNPDEEFLDMLFEGLFKNFKRYGYPSCPCRLADGEYKKDIDIICPCYYRDPDLIDYGRCFCALYVNEDYISGKKGRGPIPERRPARKPLKEKKKKRGGESVGVKRIGELYRCNVCGNEVTVSKVGGGTLVCCGEDMELLK